MDKEYKIKIGKIIFQAAKIAVGSCGAISIAMALNLEYATTAGIITLLSIVPTKWDTLKLSMYRVITFLLSVIVAWTFFQHMNSEWLAYGLFIFLLVVFSEWTGLKTTISVNAVTGTHFLMTHDFSLEFILNEFLLVLIGIGFAAVLNLFHYNNAQQRSLVEDMRYVERKLQQIMEELEKYLRNIPMDENVWDDIIALEKKLEYHVEAAYEYQNNTFQSHPGYYIDYFEMRTKQCNVLHNLHYEMKKIRYIPKEADIVADYISYLRPFVTEKNDPTPQIEKLHELFDEIHYYELPKTTDDFESRAKLYHILMDLEEFLIFNRRFVEGLDERQRRIYWEE